MLNERQELLHAKDLVLGEYSAGKDHTQSAILAGNIIGVGIGNRIKDGKRDETQECVRFYVERKIKPKQAVAQALLIKAQYGGVGTDVIEARRFVSFQSKAGPGSSIGLAYRAPNVDPSLVGTLGAFVNIDGDYYVLGSNHVMAVNGRVPIGTRMLFRPPGEFVDDPDKSIFASITAHVPLRPQLLNRVDCALAKVEKKYRRLIETDFPKWIVVASAKPVEPTRGMKVKRVDQTEQAQGVIRDAHSRVKIEFSFGAFEFDDLILIEGEGGRFAKPGDSGALVVVYGEDVQENNGAAALVLGGTRDYTIACRLSTAIAELREAIPKQLAALAEAQNKAVKARIAELTDAVVKHKEAAGSRPTLAAGTQELPKIELVVGSPPKKSRKAASSTKGTEYGQPTTAG